MFGRGYGPGASCFSGGSGLFLMMGIRLLIFAALVFVGIKLYKKYATHSRSALKMLDEKFAMGEISEEEYINRKTVLNKKN
ncbi:SHOCT domain-containing protein [Clostridium sp. CF012]|uniref:SHOCT domain-containing protein n=1 Tax=Clostridium sp. CF012 TaxID=2843319 RepID=UPI001C0CF4F1|nr:SHOCT domain-containing protein [Clostridium sp. CF012]MBU3143352.1 SHOCT domain-containing protein [Clostridium sp. CF012]